MDKYTVSSWCWVIFKSWLSINLFAQWKVNCFLRSDMLLHLSYVMYCNNCEKTDYSLSWITNVLDYTNSSHGLSPPLFQDYVNFRSSDVTNPGGSSCSPYQCHFCKSKHLLSLQMLFMPKQQHYTLTKVRKVKS